MSAYPNQITRIAIWVAVWCMVPFWAHCGEREPFLLRSSIVPDTDIWVGQRVLYKIDVLGKNGWARIQRIPDIQVPGAIFVNFESQGVRLNETIGGDSYTGQRYELSLFPQRASSISIPAVTVDIEIRQWGAGEQKGALKGEIPSVQFRAQMPPGAQKDIGLISTARLTASQQWDPEVNRVTVGGAIQRTIQLSAENVSAMAFTPIVFNGSNRFDTYPKTPFVDDKFDRGTLTGRRTETVTYVFTNTGSATLPAVVISWWDLKKRELRETVLPSMEIEVAPAAATSGSHLAAGGASGWKPWMYIGIVGVVLVLLVVMSHKKVRLWWQNRQREKSQSEKAFFQKFVKAARSGKPADTLNALMRWLDRITIGNRAARLDQFLDTFSDPEGIREADSLHLAIGANSQSQSSWQGRNLIAKVSQARRKWLVQRHKIKTSHPHLPRLNPR